MFYPRLVWNSLALLSFCMMTLEFPREHISPVVMVREGPERDQLLKALDALGVDLD